MIDVDFFEISPQFGQHLLTKSSLKDVADFSRIWAKNAGFGQNRVFCQKKQGLNRIVLDEFSKYFLRPISQN